MKDEILLEIKKKKKWHHDIKKIDGEWVEDIVSRYQRVTNLGLRDFLLGKILDNYSVFKNTWGKAYGQYLDNDIEAGKQMHDEIVWRSANKFNMEKCKKPKGTAFNAYLVSSQMNWLKNLRNAKMSHKNHPRVICPICGEQVYQIDNQHLRHRMTMERFQKMYPTAILVDRNGETVSNTEYCTVEKFWQEHPMLKSQFPVNCPITGVLLNEIPENYTSTLFKGYTEKEFLADFPDFKGAIICPFTGKKKLTITQEYLDTVLKQENKEIIKQVPTFNPYTEETVPEITFDMLSAVGVSVHQHVYEYATIQLNKKYPDVVRCPFTGRKTYCITDEDLKKLNKTPWEFYLAVCKYPLRKFQIKCRVCSQWVDNMWEHLETVEHCYTDAYTPEDFSRDYASIATRAFVSTNCFFESDSGDTTHISDLVSFHFDSSKAMEVEDSLLHVAQDDMDRQIATSIRSCQTMEDVYYASATKNEIPIPEKDVDMKDIRYAIRKKTGNNDFDVFTKSEQGKVIVSFPSKDTIRKRLQRMIEASDLVNEFPAVVCQIKKEQQKCQTTTKTCC